MEEKEAERKRADLTEFLPPAWLSAGETGIWVRCYWSQRVDRSAAAPPRVIDLVGVRGVLLFGIVDYLPSTRLVARSVSDDVVEFESSALAPRATPEGTYLLLMTPHPFEGGEAKEPATRARLDAAVGLLAAAAGRNLVYEKVFENVIELASGRATVHGDTVLNPNSFPRPDVSDIGLTALGRLDERIESLHEQERNRVRLSLRWFEAASRDTGVDAFLKYWVALECIAMPDTTKVKPVIESLALSYGVPKAEVRDTFQVGLLFRLRGRIVHGGLVVPIHERLLDYIEALYVDVLMPRLGFPSRRRAKAAADRPDFDLGAYMRLASDS